MATGIVPIIKLLELVKPHFAGNLEAKTLFSDVITLMGQVQYNLSLRRIYMIKLHLKKKYQNLCHISMPVSTNFITSSYFRAQMRCAQVIVVFISAHFALKVLRRVFTLPVYWHI